MPNPSPNPSEKKDLPPFAPPSQEAMQKMKPGAEEAKETAEKIQREKVAAPERYKVNHELVGPWRKDQVLTAKEIHDHLAGRAHGVDDEAERNEHVNRLVSLGAIVPHHE